MMKIISLIVDENWQAYEAFTINIYDIYDNYYAQASYQLS